MSRDGSRSFPPSADRDRLQYQAVLAGTPRSFTRVDVDCSAGEAFRQLGKPPPDGPFYSGSEMADDHLTTPGQARQQLAIKPTPVRLYRAAVRGAMAVNVIPADPVLILPPS
jgi:hypothetical protein